MSLTFFNRLILVTSLRLKLKLDGDTRVGEAQAYNAKKSIKESKIADPSGHPGA
jgi:hypothetical protein